MQFNLGWLPPETQHNTRRAPAWSQAAWSPTLTPASPLTRPTQCSSSSCVRTAGSLLRRLQWVAARPALWFLVAGVPQMQMCSRAHHHAPCFSSTDAAVLSPVYQLAPRPSHCICQDCHPVSCCPSSAVRALYCQLWNHPLSPAHEVIT